MSKQELNDCLKSSYTSARKQDGSYYKTSSMKSIRAAIDRFLRSPPHCKQFSIIGDPAFTEANQVLDAFVKDLRKTGKLAGVVHKKPIAKQQIQRLYECGELGPANSTNPAQLQRTVWFYLVLYFGQRGRENQRLQLHLQSSANNRAFIARGGQIFPRPQYNFSNCNVQIHNHYGQSG